MPTIHRHAHSAFTLQEGLIVLGILGLLMTFFIPKLIESNQDTASKVLLKEALSRAEAAATEAAAEGVLNTSLTTYKIMATAFPITKACPSNAVTQGCWSGSTLVDGAYIQKGLVTQAGIEFSGLYNDIGVNPDKFIIGDGAKGANTVGVDELQLVLCWTSGGCAASAIPPPAGYRANYGDIYPVNTVANKALYDSLKR
jgi:type II secretory pathway pseudopilin PulG